MELAGRKALGIPSSSTGPLLFAHRSCLLETATAYTWSWEPARLIRSKNRVAKPSATP